MTEHPTLTAALDPLVHAALADASLLEGVLSQYGSPAHLVFPQVMVRNAARLRTVLRRSTESYRICYAHKVNQSQAFIRTAARCGLAVDVASAGELRSALAAGFPRDQIEVTGPKGRRFLTQLVETGVTINVDNLWELETLGALAVQYGQVIPVLLRISGLFPGHRSRFGIRLSQAHQALDLLAAHSEKIQFLGFSFHLDSSETLDRLRATEQCLPLVEQAYQQGLTPTVLNIGGGLRQVFLTDIPGFHQYTEALRTALLRRENSLTWGDNTFGWQVSRDGVSGVPVFHKYGNTISAPRMLSEILSTPLEQHARTVAQLCADNLLELWLEPGKSLVDQAGITVATVEFVTESDEGALLVNLDVSRDLVTPADQEAMVDPIMQYTDPAPCDIPRSVGVYFTGRLCLERDVITTRKVWLPKPPQPGDRVIFPNTAAYHMDLSAATASMHPPVVKVALTYGAKRFRSCLDTEYHPPSAPIAKAR